MTVTMNTLTTDEHEEKVHAQTIQSIEREKLAKQVEKVLGMREKSMARYQVKPSEVLIDELATLGKGRYGVVKEGLLYGETVAVKVLSALADEKAIESFVDEIDILGPVSLNSWKVCVLRINFALILLSQGPALVSRSCRYEPT